MTNEDFYNYYEAPLRDLRYCEDWEVHSLFPYEASNTAEGKKKALNALYRFSQVNLIEFFPQENPTTALQFLKEAPLDDISTPDDFVEAWMGTLISGTYPFIEKQATELGMPEDEDEPVSPDFRKNLEALFEGYGVGFDKENVYPPS